jgi:ring-1,2-phenylacetyl-CoA epoxidase subunit PaaE
MSTSVRTQYHPLRVASVEPETADAVAIRLEVPKPLWEIFRARPGQHLPLRSFIDGQDVRRTYSIFAGSPETGLCIAVKRQPHGVFSTYANTVLKPGDFIDALPPAGHFTVSPAPDARRTYVAFAAGSGITPILGMLQSVLTIEQESRFLLFYGNRSTANIMFRDTLEALKNRFMARLSIAHILSRERQEVAWLNGRIDREKVLQVLPRLVAPTAIDQALICGPGGMIETLSEALRELGLPAERIRSEHFTLAPDSQKALQAASPSAAAPVAATATVIMQGIETLVPIAPGEVIVDAALRAGLDVPYSCKGGMCSTCRARLLEGEVSMDLNYALEPWEVEAGYILTCQSHPISQHLVVDYDHA